VHSFSIHPFYIIVGLTLVLGPAWWWLSVRLSRGHWWVWLAWIFPGVQLAVFLLVLSERLLPPGFDHHIPRFLLAGTLLWHGLGLGLILLFGLPVGLIWLAWRGIRALRPALVPAGNMAAAPNGPLRSRREFLGLSAAALPPLFTFSLSGIALRQLDRFRVRRFTLGVAGLPRDLDGMTIAQVSDMHVGRFTSGRVLRAMVNTVNDLRTDLVLLTGDLIDRELYDLSGALDLARAMQGRFGHCLIEGNHDLFENPAEFERRARASGIPFLLDDATVLRVRGQPVQLLGIRWSGGDGRRQDPHETAIADSVRTVLRQRETGAFPILLAHHPHAFDAAAAAGFPLTLSGHTHGGQLMVNAETGVGPLIFRYWSGHYTKGPSQLIVSNGVGNWFPLRVNAPAEIVHLTLRRA
jgi:predicted MPP superfamily phosphohydrolase